MTYFDPGSLLKIVCTVNLEMKCVMVSVCCFSVREKFRCDGLNKFCSVTVITFATYQTMYWLVTEANNI